MESEWNEVRLGDLVDRGALLISVGYRVRNEELGAQGIPFVRGGDIGDGWINTNTVDHIRTELADRVRAKLAQPGDVAFIIKGTVGRAGRLRHGQPLVVFAPQVAYWRVLAPDVLDSRFLFYLIQSHAFQAALDSVKTRGSMVADYVSLSLQHDFVFNLPNIGTQRAIGHILGVLDDKIELNRQMNETLEAMSRALFKSWFVDFQPVHIKAEGRDPDEPNSLANLFPASFEDSELGKIPKEWTVDSVYAAADVIYGAPFSSERFNNSRTGKPLIRIRDLADESPEVFTTEQHPKGYLVKPGDIVVGMDGLFRAHLWGGVESWLNQRVCVFKPRCGFSAPFVLNSIVGLLAEVEATETATTVIHLGKNDIDRFRIIVPSQAALEAFNRLTIPLFQKIVANKQESVTLSVLRDNLLPKLISGELRVKEVEHLAAVSG